MITLCTMWDSAYHAKGLALLDSLRRNLREYYKVYVLALDEHVERYFSEHLCAGVELVGLDDIETDELLAIKPFRSHAEYIWTLTPCLTAYCLGNKCEADVAYIDADCYLFSDLAPLYAEVGKAPAAIIPHRWTPRHADRLRPNGIYNVGWVYFSQAGSPCLWRWRSQCIERCSLAVGCADQGYLDDWPERWGAHVVQHLGANLAPWSQEQYTYRIDGGLYISDGRRDDPLLFYHFHEFIPGRRRTNYALHPMVARHVYPEYEAHFG